MRTYAALPAFEGAPASYRNPYATMQAGAGQLTAGPDGVILGRFAWNEPATGRVSNARTTDTQVLGFALPQWGTWNKLYCQDRTWILREGLMVTLAVKGDFFARFAGGAYPGQAVWANLVDGSAAAFPSEWTADSSIVSADSETEGAGGATAEATSWTVMDFVPPGGLGRITSWQPAFFN